MPVSCGNGLAENQIRDLEKIFSLSFPDDYKDFLSRYNGFVVKQPDFCEFDYDSVDDGAIAFYALFGYGISNRNDELVYQNNEYLDEIDFISNAFIIGSDPGGNYFVLVCEGEKKGVYYWDRTHLHSEDDLQKFDINAENVSGPLYKFSDNFYDFFERLVINTLSAGMKLYRDL
ncbi:SMI1/KNR4 family protein [Salmonella enterica]|nr:SMI1/KNR4 family protein [Salmonella enterica subsp. enterica serovar Stanleyville]